MDRKSMSIRALATMPIPIKIWFVTVTKLVGIEKKRQAPCIEKVGQTKLCGACHANCHLTTAKSQAKK
jgi:hypothetical protein